MVASGELAASVGTTALSVLLPIVTALADAAREQFGNPNTPVQPGDPWPIAHPTFDFHYVKAYYARFGDQLHGRATRLLVTPLVRALSQSGLNPANCRLLDQSEAQLTGAGDGAQARLVLGFESASQPVDPLMDQALELVRDHGGDPGEVRGSGDGSVGAWRDAFLSAPYLRDALVSIGILSETFETAITWDRFEEFHTTVSETASSPPSLSFIPKTPVGRPDGTSTTRSMEPAASVRTSPRAICRSRLSRVNR